MIKWMTGALGVAVVCAVASLGVSAQQNQMSFFVTSVGSGMGANLGGLGGADKHCQQLAAAAGAGNRTWRDRKSTRLNSSHSQISYAVFCLKKKKNKKKQQQRHTTDNNDTQ